MSVIHAIMSAYNHPGSGLNSNFSVESPMFTFSRMCFGYLHNDWSTVISSGITLIITTVSLIFVGTNHICSNSHGYATSSNNPN